VFSGPAVITAAVEATEKKIFSYLIHVISSEELENAKFLLFICLYVNETMLFYV